MGLSHSKITNEAKTDAENVEKASLPSTPISTPQSPRKVEVDPRSPSAHIWRTPLELDVFTIDDHEIQSGEVFYSPLKGELAPYGIDPRSPTTAFLRTPIILNTSKNNLFLDSSSNSHEIFESPVKTNITVLETDPRSPTNEFVRTPIVVNSSNDSLIKIVHNKNMEKLHSEISATPQKRNIIGPKLLESSPVRSRNQAYKRKSFVGLLETNIDFTETDIDAVLKAKCRIKDKDSTEILTDSECSKNEEFSSGSKYFKADFEEAIDIQNNFVLNNVVDLIMNESKKSENGPEQEIVSTKENISIEECKTEENEIIQEIDKDFELLKEIKSAPLTPRIEKVEPSPIVESKSAPITPPLVNITANVKELDKKLTNLIYEDQDIVVCPRIVQLKDVFERSPLKNRNGAEIETSKSAQKLKVSDRPRKSDYAVSKIPVYRTKGNKKVQCENTPPRNLEKKTKIGKKTHWDNNDVTLYL